MLAGLNTTLSATGSSRSKSKPASFHPATSVETGAPERTLARATVAPGEIGESDPAGGASSPPHATATSVNTNATNTNLTRVGRIQQGSGSRRVGMFGRA